MTEKDIEQRLRQHFNTAPLPKEEAIENTVRIVSHEAVRQQAEQAPPLLAPHFGRLIMAQVRLTKGLVWILQAAVILFALIIAAQADNLSATFAAFGSASAIIAGISVAGIIYGKGSAFTEINYTCHFDYRQVVVARMVVYGAGDLLALLALTALGSSLLPIGFGSIVACAGTSFFLTSFACLLLLSRYRGDSGLILCTITSLLIAVLLAYFWDMYPRFIHVATIDLWPLVILCAGAGTILCARSLLNKINSGFDHIKPKTN